jgi:hypothetical protein
MMWIIQKYIERPLLYYGRKFDIRIWVILTNKFEIYCYSEGYARLSSEIYDLDDTDNEMIHLTNHCLQVNNENYGKFVKGNIISLATLQQYINDTSDHYVIRFF